MAKRTCSADGCDKTAKGLGWCNVHYQRWRKYGDPRADVPVRAKVRGRLCSIEGCGRKHTTRGLCPTHHWRRQQHGDPQAGRPVRKLRLRSQRLCSIPDCDKPHAARGWCEAHYKRWQQHGDPNVLLATAKGQADYYHQGYHFIYANGRTIQEHRHVMEQHLGRGLLPGEEVHHRNGHRADNRLENLELWAVSQPKGQRARDLLAWAEEVVARYGPERDKL